MGRILLTDGQQRKTLAAVRSLGQQGHEVWVADETRFSTSRFSRFAHRGLICPPPDRPEQYLDWLLAAQRRYGLEVLLPMDDLTTQLAIEHQARLPMQTLLPTAEQFHTGRDKAATAILAARAGVRYPVSFAAASLPEALAYAGRIGYPVVLKSRQSAGGRGIFFAASPAEVAAAWARARPEWGGFLVQERIAAGRKFDVCLLFGPAGDLRASFVQEELRWFPLEYGASTVQESVHRPDLVALARRLLAPVGWRGPVEVEFMADPSGEPVLMEINPRFWASLALAIRCGVDFPDLTVRLACSGDAAGPASYPAGVRCRWLLPGDLLHALARRGRAISPPFFRTGAFDDIISAADPGPTLGVALAMVRYSLSRRMWKVLMRW